MVVCPVQIDHLCIFLTIHELLTGVRPYILYLWLVVYLSIYLSIIRGNYCFAPPDFILPSESQLNQRLNIFLSACGLIKIAFVSLQEEEFGSPVYLVLHYSGQSIQSINTQPNLQSCSYSGPF